MSKILKSFGLAALLVALLAGTGMAEPDDSEVTGTLQLTYTLEATDDVDLGNLATVDTWKNVSAWVNVTALNGEMNVQALLGNTGHLNHATKGNLGNVLYVGTPEAEAKAMTGANVAVFTTAAEVDKAMWFCQKTHADDKAGTYTGTVTFSAIAT